MKDRELDITHAHNSAVIIAGLHKTLGEINLQERGQARQLSKLIEQIDKHLGETTKSAEFGIWQIVSTGLHTLQSQLKCREIALAGDGEILSERERLSVLCSELRTQLSSFPARRDGGSILTEEVIEHDNRTVNLDRLLAFLRSVPIPITYWKRKNANYPFQRRSSENEETGTSITPLVRVIAFIDDTPLISPQFLQPQLMYSLKFIVRGIIWHSEAIKLRLDLLTTFPATNYSVSDFVLQKPVKIEDDQYEGELAGHIRFSTAQTLLSENISFVVRCAFQLSNGSHYEVPVIGYNQLEFRIVDPERHGFMSGHRRLDQHVAKLLEDLRAENPAIRDELPELHPVLEALTKLLGTYAQGAVFKNKGKISEKEFHSDVLRDLRFILGQEVQEHPSQAGGYTDIRYRGVVIELKVEDENGDRTHICQKYARQAVQYESVEARQVSVVLVLDLTPKHEPSGDIRNDILLHDVPTHGGKDNEKQYPSKAFVFVVNGNIQDPSAYSGKQSSRRRKSSK